VAERLRPAGYLQTADRALQVLGAFTADRPEWGVTDLARSLELDKSQVQRLLATLARRDFLVANPDTRRYRLGPALVALGRLAEQSDGVLRLVRPALARLAQRCGESAVFSVPDGNRYRCAAAADGPGPLRYTSIIGDIFPGYGGASGHAIFAFYPEAELRAMFGETIERTTATTAGSLGELLTRYAEVRRRGWSVSDGEHDARVMAVAAPVFDRGAVVGSLTVVGPRESLAGHVDRLAHEVCEVARELGQLFSAGRP
jgi:IclR family transcriptional regulator, acetate operon repressor